MILKEDPNKLFIPDFSPSIENVINEISIILTKSIEILSLFRRLDTEMLEMRKNKIQELIGQKQFNFNSEEIVLENKKKNYRESILFDSSILVKEI